MEELEHLGMWVQGANRNIWTPNATLPYVLQPTSTQVFWLMSGVCIYACMPYTGIEQQ